MKHICLNKNFESEFVSQLKRALALGLWPVRKKSTVEENIFNKVHQISLTKTQQIHHIVDIFYSS